MFHNYPILLKHYNKIDQTSSGGEGGTTHLVKNQTNLIVIVVILQNMAMNIGKSGVYLKVRENVYHLSKKLFIMTNTNLIIIIY